MINIVSNLSNVTIVPLGAVGGCSNVFHLKKEVLDSFLMEDLNPFFPEVLIIEDNPSTAKLLEKDLENASQLECSITWVQWFQDGLKELNERKFDLILLDLTLPDAAGKKVIQTVQSLCGDTPIIVVTGSSDEDLKEQLESFGIENYLLKGKYQIKELEGLVLKALSH